MRPGEACRLDRGDVDLDDGDAARCADSKFGKSRRCPPPHHRRPRCAPTSAPATGRSGRRARPRFLVHSPAARWTPQHLANVRRAGHGRPASRPRPGSGPAAARPAALLRRRDAAGLVPRRRRRARPASRCCRPGSGTSTRSRPTGTCRPSRNCSPWPPPGLEHAGRATGGIMTDLAPSCRASSPTGCPAEEGQPAHRRRLPRHLPAPARLRPSQDRQGAQPAQPRRPRRRADRRVPASPGDTSGATAAPPATPAWPRSTPCSATPPSNAPEHAAVISQVLAIPPKRRDRAIVSYLTARRDRRADRRPRPRAPGTAAATTPCSCSPSRPGCGSPS